MMNNYINNNIIEKNYINSKNLLLSTHYPHLTYLPIFLGKKFLNFKKKRRGHLINIGYNFFFKIFSVYFNTELKEKNNICSMPIIFNRNWWLKKNKVYVISQQFTFNSKFINGHMNIYKNNKFSKLGFQAWQKILINLYSLNFLNFFHKCDDNKFFYLNKNFYKKKDNRINILFNTTTIIEKLKKSFFFNFSNYHSLQFNFMKIVNNFFFKEHYFINFNLLGLSNANISGYVNSNNFIESDNVHALKFEIKFLNYWNKVYINKFTNNFINYYIFNQFFDSLYFNILKTNHSINRIEFNKEINFNFYTNINNDIYSNNTVTNGFFLLNIFFFLLKSIINNIKIKKSCNYKNINENDNDNIIYDRLNNEFFSIIFIFKKYIKIYLFIILQNIFNQFNIINSLKNFVFVSDEFCKFFSKGLLVFFFKRFNMFKIFSKYTVLNNLKKKKNVFLNKNNLILKKIILNYISNMIECCYKLDFNNFFNKNSISYNNFLLKINQNNLNELNDFFFSKLTLSGYFEKHNFYKNFFDINIKNYIYMDNKDNFLRQKENFYYQTWRRKLFLLNKLKQKRNYKNNNFQDKKNKVIDFKKNFIKFKKKSLKQKKFNFINDKKKNDPFFRKIYYKYNKFKFLKNQVKKKLFFFKTRDRRKLNFLKKQLVKSNFFKKKKKSLKIYSYNFFKNLNLFNKNNHFLLEKNCRYKSYLKKLINNNNFFKNLFKSFFYKKKLINFLKKKNIYFSKYLKNNDREEHRIFLKNWINNNKFNNKLLYKNKKNWESNLVFNIFKNRNIKKNEVFFSFKGERTRFLQNYKLYYIYNIKKIFKEIKSLSIFNQFWRLCLDNHYLIYYKYLIKNTNFFFFKKIKLYNFFLKKKTNQTFFKKKITNKDKLFLLNSYYLHINNDFFNNNKFNNSLKQKDLLILFFEMLLNNQFNSFNFLNFLKKNKVFIAYNRHNINYNYNLLNNYLNAFLIKNNYDFIKWSECKKYFIKTYKNNRKATKFYKYYVYINKFFNSLKRSNFKNNFNTTKNKCTLFSKWIKFFKKKKLFNNNRKFFKKKNLFNNNRKFFKKKKLFNNNRTYNKGKKKIGFEEMTYYSNHFFNKRVFMVWYLNFFNLFTLYRKENKFWINIKYFLKFLRALKRFFTYYYLILFLLKELFFLKEDSYNNSIHLSKKNSFFYKFNKRKLLLIFFKRIIIYINKSFSSLYFFIKFFFKTKINNFIEYNYYNFKFFKEKNLFFLNCFVLNTYNNFTSLKNKDNFVFQQKNVNLFDNLTIFNKNCINKFKRKLSLFSNIYKNKILSKNTQFLTLKNILYYNYTNIFFLIINKIFFLKNREKKFIITKKKILNFFIPKKKLINKKNEKFKKKKKNFYLNKKYCFEQRNFILNQLKLINYFNFNDNYKNVNLSIDLLIQNTNNNNGLKKNLLSLLFFSYYNNIYTMYKYLILNNYIFYFFFFKKLKSLFKSVVHVSKVLSCFYKRIELYKNNYIFQNKQNSIIYYNNNIFSEKKEKYYYNSFNTNSISFFFKYNILLLTNTLNKKDINNIIYKKYTNKKNFNFLKKKNIFLDLNNYNYINYILNNFFSKNIILNKKNTNNSNIFNKKKVRDNFFNTIKRNVKNYCFNKSKKLEDLHFFLKYFKKNILDRKKYVLKKDFSFNSYYNKFTILKDFDKNYYPTDNITRSSLFYLKKYAGKVLNENLYTAIFNKSENIFKNKQNFMFKLKTNFFKREVFFFILYKLFFSFDSKSKFFLPINWYNYVLYKYNKTFLKSILKKKKNIIINNIKKNKHFFLKFFKDNKFFVSLMKKYNLFSCCKNNISKVYKNNSKKKVKFFFNKVKKHININFIKSKTKHYLFSWRKDRNTVSFLKNDNNIKALKFYNYTFKRLFYNVGTCFINNHLLKNFKLNKLRTSLCLPKDEFIVFNDLNNYKNNFFKKFFIKKFWFNFFKYPLKIKKNKKFQKLLKQKKYINKQINKLSLYQRNFLKRRTLYNYFINNIILNKKKVLKFKKINKKKVLIFKKLKIKKVLFFRKLIKRNRNFFKKFLFHSRFYSAKNKFINAIRNKFSILYKNFKKILFNIMIILTKHSFSSFHKFFLLFYKNNNNYNNLYKQKLLFSVDDNSLNLILRLRWILFFRLFCFYKIIINNIPKFFYIFDYSAFLNFDENKIKFLLIDKEIKRLKYFNILKQNILLNIKKKICI